MIPPEILANAKVCCFTLRPAFLTIVGSCDRHSHQSRISWFCSLWFWTRSRQARGWLLVRSLCASNRRSWVWRSNRFRADRLCLYSQRCRRCQDIQPTREHNAGWECLDRRGTSRPQCRSCRCCQSQECSGSVFIQQNQRSIRWCLN